MREQKKSQKKSKRERELELEKERNRQINGKKWERDGKKEKGREWDEMREEEY